MSVHPPLDLRARATQAMLDNGFAPDLSPEAESQIQRLPALKATPGLRDLRNLLWSSIDNDESRDLDQIEVVNRLPGDGLRILVGIADVSAFVPPGSPIDRHANANTATIYTGVETFPMLPETLSTGLTSLLDNQDRLAVVIEMILDTAGEVTGSDIYPALVRNHARLTYDAIGGWLENESAPQQERPRPESAEKEHHAGSRPALLPTSVASVEGLEAQLRLQQEASRRIHTRRLQAGALEFETVEARPVVQDGHVVALTVPAKNEARRLIENFMIAANTTMATFLTALGQPSIQRVVRAPERWNRICELAQTLGETLPPTPDAHLLSAFLAGRKAADPDHFPDLSLAVVKLLGPGEYAVVAGPDDVQGHFGLAAYRYTHSTAPNRRYADLIVQRLLKAVVAQSSAPYSKDELARIAAHCTERENAARKVERLMRKVIAANLLHDQIGHTYSAIVTGASQKGTYVRVLAPPVEGRVVHNEVGLDVGDKVQVRLLAADTEHGFIDFARV